MSSTFDLAAEYWNIYLEANPTYATLIGVHDYDDQIEQVSEQAVGEYTEKLRDLRRRVDGLDPADDAVTGSLLAAVLDADLTECDTEILVNPVDAYLGPHTRLLRSVAQSTALTADQASDLADRYRKVPEFLEDSADYQADQTRRGLSPAAVNVARVEDQINAYLASDVGSDPFVGLKLPEGWDGADQWRNDMKGLVERTIRPAFAAYRQRLLDEIAPRSRDDDHVGLCHVPDGLERYRHLTERFVTKPYDPAVIHEIGVEYATERLPDEFATVGQEAFGLSDLGSIIGRLRDDSDLKYSDEDEMLSHAEEIVSRAWASIDGWLGARPDGPCRVLPVPASLAKDMPPAYYMQPAPDGSRPGTYFLNTHNPGQRDRWAAEAVAFHEAIPGHHFDRALASQLSDLPAFRRMRAHNVHAEGWGLYSERLADEMGLYSGPVDRLGMLSADAWRAGRLVVDTGMHHHGWSRDQAIEFLETYTGIGSETVRQEVDRYIGWPGQALSYKMGQIDVRRLRDEAETVLGDRFDIVGFHDTLLTQGSVTLPVLGQLVEAWMSSVQDENL